MYYVYYSKNNQDRYNVFIVPNHYSHTLKYIKEVVNKCKEWGLTPPKDTERISVEVLAGEKHRRML